MTDVFPLNSTKRNLSKNFMKIYKIELNRVRHLYRCYKTRAFKKFVFLRMKSIKTVIKSSKLYTDDKTSENGIFYPGNRQSHKNNFGDTRRKRRSSFTNYVNLLH